MPKSPSLREDEGRIMESILKNQEIQDSLNEAFTSGRRKQQAACEHFAPGLDCDADTLRKIWTKMRQAGDTRKSQGRDPEEKRQRSSRAGSSEPSRRSVRLQGSSTASSVVCESTEGSCSSSLCNSPNETVPPKKTSTSSAKRASAANRSLCPISEVAATTEEEPVTSSYQQADANATLVQEEDPKKEADAESVETLVDTEQPETACVTARDSNLIKYFQEPTVLETKPPRQRHSEPSVTVQQSTNTRSWQDPTRVFFESMALTVMGFPQHRQAEVKRQVSLIVHDLEYDLNSPGGGLTVS